LRAIPWCFLSPDIVRSEGGGDPDGFRSIG
jgi:hypothetical protein